MTSRRAFLRTDGGSRRRAGPRGRRRWLRARRPPSGAATAGKATDIRIDEVTRRATRSIAIASPLKFGGTLTDRVTILNVQLRRLDEERQERAGLRVDADGQRVVVAVAHAVLRPDAAAR